MEVIVPVVPSMDQVRLLRDEFPSVRFVNIEALPADIDMADPAFAHLVYDRRRTAGLGAARGRIVALTEDQMIPDADWCARVVHAHREPHGAIGGAVENAGNSTLHLALFLCDFGRYQKPFAAGNASCLTDQNVSYKRTALEKVRHVWADYYHEPAVHEALLAAGETLWLDPDCVVRFHRGKLQMRQQLRERFAWGRVFGGKLAQRIPLPRRALLLAFSPLIPIVILFKRLVTAHRKGLSPMQILKVLPVMTILILFWACGEATGYLTARPFADSNIDY